MQNGTSLIGSSVDKLAQKLVYAATILLAIIKLLCVVPLKPQGNTAASESGNKVSLYLSTLSLVTT